MADNVCDYCKGGEWSGSRLHQVERSNHQYWPIMKKCLALRAWHIIRVRISNKTNARPSLIVWRRRRRSTYPLAITAYNYIILTSNINPPPTILKKKKNSSEWYIMTWLNGRRDHVMFYGLYMYYYYCILSPVILVPFSHVAIITTRKSDL